MTRSEILLIQLMEEAAEVIQIASKCLRFGPGEIYPQGNGKTNSERLQDEVTDFLAIAELLDSAGILPSPPFEVVLEAITKKKYKVEEYLSYSEKLGILK